ncbi:hypothetical protein L6164_017299 [Bauhinia variegata]|uniref:Uncharacterized protein n=1 Tax=Bauhinia variegata TaxID=167791 RepID=A0ACB9N887_BAUVA|nr:hypothetical protein L6164_017299 [Bauhinia variegata]
MKHFSGYLGFAGNEASKWLSYAASLFFCQLGQGFVKANHAAALFPWLKLPKNGSRSSKERSKRIDRVGPERKQVSLKELLGRSGVSLTLFT